MTTSATTDEQRTHQLLALALRLGIATEYWDVKGNRHHASVDALLGAIGAMGYEANGLGSVAAVMRVHDEERLAAVTEPVLVNWIGRPFGFDLRLPAGAPSGLVELTVELEGGGEQHLGSFDLATQTGRDESRGHASVRVIRLELGVVDLPMGYHRLRLTGSGVAGRADEPRALFVAPVTGARLDPFDRLWGLFSPVYALPGGSGLGAHLGDLRELAASMDRLGGKIVGTLPVLATWLGTPFDPSPYAPVSRRFWNELYIDLRRMPELALSPVASNNLDGLRSIGHAANVKGRTFDYRHQYGYVRGVLEQVVAARADWPADQQRDFARFLEHHDEVTDYARFRSCAERRGEGWHGWPAGPATGSISDRDVDPAVVLLHQFAQYAMSRDLDQLDSDLRGRGQRLYLDLPIGAHGDGYDTWKHQDLFAWGAGAGAPPDDFFEDGQNWGFPPIRPAVSRQDGHRHVRDVLHHHMAVAGILRLDHVMGLHRLYWVPDGLRAKDGVYVTYPQDELFAIVAIESAGHDCVVVGEDLGTVPDEVRHAMRDHDMLGMYVAEFNQPAWSGTPLAPPHTDQLASIDTHDTPTFTGWLRGLDIDRRRDQGMLDDLAATDARRDRDKQVENLVAFLRARGDLSPKSDHRDEPALLKALCRYLGDGDAPAVLVALDDLVGESNPQNVPGTMNDRPNWVQRLPVTLDELFADDRILSVLDALQDCRLGSHLRAREAST